MCLLVWVIVWRLFENLFQTMRDLQILRCRYCLQCFFFITTQFFMLCFPLLQSYSVVPMFVWMGPGPQSALKIVVWTFAEVICMQKYVSIQSVFIASPHRKVLKKKKFLPGRCARHKWKRPEIPLECILYSAFEWGNSFQCYPSFNDCTGMKAVLRF